MRTYLDFEKPVAELEAKVEELRAIQESRATRLPFWKKFRAWRAKPVKPFRTSTRPLPRGRRPKWRATHSARTALISALC